MRGIHRSPVNSPHKGQWRGALIFSLICVWINGWVNNREAGDLRWHRAHYDVIVMTYNRYHIPMHAKQIGMKYHAAHPSHIFCLVGHSFITESALQWRHNEHDGVSNYQPHHCLLNCLFKAQIKENIKAPRRWPLCGEFTGHQWISRTKASKAENVSFWWRHHGIWNNQMLKL